MNGPRLTGAHAPPPCQEVTAEGWQGRHQVVAARPGGHRSTELLLVEHLNIQSLKPKLPDLRYDLREVFDFDILALNPACRGKSRQPAGRGITWEIKE